MSEASKALEEAAKFCAEQAIKAKDSHDAMRYTQAACNATYAMNSLKDAKTERPAK